MIDASVKEVRKEGQYSLESNPLLGYVSLDVGVLLDDEAELQIEETKIDEGKYRTVVTISLAPKAMLKGKGSKEEIT